MDPLIPGLPEEVAAECLLRVHHAGFPTVRSVCRRWRAEIESPAFHGLRRLRGRRRTVVALTQCEQPSSHGGGPLQKHPEEPAASAAAMPYRVALFDAGAAAWDVLPPIPWLPHGLPMFCQVASADQSLVVVGGWEPSTWAASDTVFVYSFVSGRWRKGARMPGPRRSFFACASDSVGTVFVAGGHDDEKNALKSAMAYDVAADRWTHLPEMAKERDECKGVFEAGAFRVVGGYPTEMQGQFSSCSEAFDVDARRWREVEEDTLEAGMCPRSCVASGGTLYRCRGGTLEAKRDAAWCTAAELPEDARLAPGVVSAGAGRLLVVGAAFHGGAHACYMLEEEEGDGKRRREWRRMPAPEEFSGHVQAGCCLEI